MRQLQMLKQYLAQLLCAVEVKFPAACMPYLLPERFDLRLVLRAQTAQKGHVHTKAHVLHPPQHHGQRQLDL